MASSTRLVSLLGLGFGDCGKGLFTDFLCRAWQAHTVVRFNGGAQAGHNVVLPDGRHHTFSQFGAGTFVPGTVTVLAYPVIVHPTALLVEDSYLRKAGVNDALHRLVIDHRCRVTTPFHQAAGRMRELARGAGAHGSCGVGVGETVSDGMAYPARCLRYADLTEPAVVLAKLEASRQAYLAEFGTSTIAGANSQAYDAERAVLNDTTLAARWFARVQELVHIARPAPHEVVASRLQHPGTILFEGAQGVLLDEWRGFHPHTTWSSIDCASVEAVAADAGQHARIEHLGVLRSYLTRHGNGPLPTHDPLLDHLAEPHNHSKGWQGRFRRGHPDAILLRYALAVAGRLDGLVVSHLDVFERKPGLRWCHGYELDASAGTGHLFERTASDGKISAIRPSPGHDLAHQAQIARSLAVVRPHYPGAPISGAAQFIAQLETLAKLPVLFGSHGPSHDAVRSLR